MDGMLQRELARLETGGSPPDFFVATGVPRLDSAAQQEPLGVVGSTHHEAVEFRQSRRMASNVGYLRRIWAAVFKLPR